MRIPTLFLLIYLLLCGVIAEAKENISFKQFSWLTGCWQGAGFGGLVEECWLQSADNRLTGVFQLTKEGHQKFSEIVMIAEFDETIGMRVKHFDAKFNQWESDQLTGHTFPLISAGEHFIQFEGLRYELIEDSCQVTLDMHSGDSINTVKFDLKRK